MSREERRKPEYLAYLSSPAWKILRKGVLGRCGGVCERCQTRKVQNVHHLHYRTFGHEALTDLLGVCRPCHMEIHGVQRHKRKRYRKNSRRKARNELRLRAIRLGVPLDVVKPLRNPPMPDKTDWTYREKLLASFKRT